MPVLGRSSIRYTNMCVASVYCVLILNQAFCEPGKIEGNGVLAFLKFVIFPILSGRGKQNLLSRI